MCELVHMACHALTLPFPLLLRGWRACLLLPTPAAAGVGGGAKGKRVRAVRAALPPSSSISFICCLEMNLEWHL
jgi:hypothetical protein